MLGRPVFQSIVTELDCGDVVEVWCDGRKHMGPWPENASHIDVIRQDDKSIRIDFLDQYGAIVDHVVMS